MARVHELKIRPEYFLPVSEGRKTFEIREDDRGFRRGDIVVLREFDPNTKKYTGRSIRKKIGYVSIFGQKQGWCVFSLL